MSLFDERDMAAITSPDFPGERLIVCRNPDLARERARKREDLLAATERDLAKIAAGVARKTQPLRGAAEIGMAVGAVLDKHKMAKHFELTIRRRRVSPSPARREQIAAGGRARRPLRRAHQPARRDPRRRRRRCAPTNRLAMVERAFRCLKTVDLHVRPIHHWLEDRVRAHVFLCMLAYYVEWHMRARLAPMLYDDDDKDAAEALRESPVAKAQRSPAALAKSATGRTADGAPVHSFQSLLADLATLARNTVVTAIAPDRPFTILTRPTPIQQKAFDLLGFPIACTQ